MQLWYFIDGEFLPFEYRKNSFYIVFVYLDPVGVYSVYKKMIWYDHFICIHSKKLLFISKLRMLKNERTPRLYIVVFIKVQIWTSCIVQNAENICAKWPNTLHVRVQLFLKIRLKFTYIFLLLEDFIKSNTACLHICRERFLLLKWWCI